MITTNQIEAILETVIDRDLPKCEELIGKWARDIPSMLCLPEVFRQRCGLTKEQLHEKLQRYLRRYRN